jgi:glyoxylase-like metal-dependent hydrolase (beta-lactamase superfamily II)
MQPTVEATGDTSVPLRYIIDTNAEPDHTGGNAILGKAGENLRADGLGAEIISHLDVDALMRAQTPARPPADLPSDTFLTPQKDFYFNDEPVVILPQPAAHAKGDAIVFLRRSEVISVGEIFVTTGYPVIRVDQGGTINGEIAALNRILEITVPKKNEDGGTMVVPGRGHLSDEADVAEYRDMLTIIRDRVADLVKKGMTLAQIKAAKPTADYDPLYSATPGPWTADMFVEAVYRSLPKNK